MLKTFRPLNSNLKLINNNFKNINTFRSFSYINQTNSSKFSHAKYQQISKRNNSNDAEKVVEETANKAVEFSSTLPDFNSNVEAVSTLTDKSLGYLKSLGMAEHPLYWMPDTIQQILELQHVYLGMQWGLAIIATTLIGKMILLPMTMKQRDTSMKQAKFQRASEPYSKKLYDGDLQNFQNISVKINKLKLKYEVEGQMKYLFLPMLVNSAFTLSMFSAIREMCTYPAMGMEVGGWSWFTDLSAVDPYLGLQLISACSIFLYTKYGMMQDMQATNPNQQSMFSSPLMMKFLKALPFVTIPLTMSLPSGVVLFITLSALSSVASSRLVKHTATRRLFGYKPYPTAEELAKMVKPKEPGAKSDGFSDMFKNFNETQRKQREFMDKYYK